MKKASIAKVRKQQGKGRARPLQVPQPAGRSRGKKPLEIPSILLEGDGSPTQAVSGPGERYALGPVVPAENFEAVKLPEAYGTQRLMLAARDPHWLYAHWDLTHEQQRAFNARSSHGHLILRVYADAIGGKPATQVHVHPESRSWFVHVGRGGTRYLAELGYHGHDGGWATIANSNATLTPPEFVATGGPVEFATVPVDISFQRLTQLAAAHATEGGSLAEALRHLHETGHPDLPEAAAFATAEWTPEQEHALAKLVNGDEVRRVQIGSLEIAELLGQVVSGPAGSMGAADVASPAGGWGGVTSPLGGEQPQKGFWFNVNAELIIYGATEPNANVSIGGCVVQLRPDGSFSYRFALPDGQYELPVVAISADGTEGRAAELKFTRATENRGDVGAHPQDPQLKPPTPDNV